MPEMSDSKYNVDSSQRPNNLQSTADYSSESPTYMTTIGSDGALTVEAERDALRLQVSNLTLALKGTCEQTSVYKNRCAGVDTVTHMLKESRLEVVKLSKQCKVLETAVTNLQNRLSTNGLSSSVNIEETELFVPGASKQTLDNLARENARLRSQLKNSENQAGKKLTEDVQSMKTNLETLEAENNQLKAQLLEMKDVKLRIIQQYEAELKVMSEKSTTSRGETEMNTTSRETRETQTVDLAPTTLEALRISLQQVSGQCMQLESQLQKSQELKEEEDKRTEAAAQDLGLTEEKFAQLKSDYEKVVMMNHRWQNHSQMKEQEVHALHARISELMEQPDQIDSVVSRATDNLKKEVAMVRAHLGRRETENAQLRQELEKTKQEAVAQRSQQPAPQFDMSIVEILKQQIQVCTEDFNTERKDREQAVNRSKQLQEEVTRLMAENNAVKTELDVLKKQLMQQSQSLRDMHTLRPDYGRVNLPAHMFQARGHQPATLVNRTPYSVGAGGSMSPSSPISSYSSRASSQEESTTNPVSQPHLDDSGVISGDRSSYTSRGSQLRGAEFDFLSLPRAATGDALEGLPSMRQFEVARHPSLASMPLPRKNIEKGEDVIMACPKCNKEFTESQSQDLLAHMDICTD